MNAAWFMAALVPLAWAAGWYGVGSRPDRWLTAAVAGWSLFSAARLVWDHAYADAVLTALGVVGFVLWRRWQWLQDDAGDDERERQAEDSGKGEHGGGGGDGAPYKPRPSR